MQKDFFDQRILKDSKNIYNGNHSNVFELADGTILKLFNRNYLYNIFQGNAGVVNSYISVKEKKVELADTLDDFPEIIKPQIMEYDERGFIGYTMPKDTNENFEKPFVSQSLTDLGVLANRLAALEQIFKRGHQRDIVFHDTLSKGNLHYNPLTRKITILDYDGLQINKLCSGEICDMLSERKNPIINTPNCLHIMENYDCYFDKNIDILTLAVEFIYMATNINIALQDEKKDYEYIKFILNFVGIDDPLFIHKIAKIFDERVDNDYIGEDILRLAKTHYLAPSGNQHAYNRFVKKG